MTDYEAWRASREAADAQAAAAAAGDAASATVTDLGPGFWMVSIAGATRGFITQVEVRGELRFEARLRHMNPGQGTRIGEYWEFERAIAALVAEPPRFVGRDPFRELTNYASREQMLERTERRRLQRRAGRYLA
ncbi:hypothetical protein OVA14_00925 [Agrococcus sp. SL85]|uniref:hypothetical protein n=1 Tax=Agrococcus sp. SL85 TaxID=2995141 RepID=UPI00226D12FF|nr:hypothetical protein [Agrococcus sp. SL85]WAC66393.1 hypothetical protein OVA14_00925 [Agrococcus sp. SL85]